MTAPRPKILDAWPDLSRWDGLLKIDRRGDLVLVGYTERCQYERAWDGVTNQCRGLIFREPTLEVVSWPFEKFFNLGEMPHTQPDALPREEFWVTEKIDGALGILYPDPETGQLAVSTRGSFTSDEGLWATEWLRKWIDAHGNPFLVERFTYLFEICAPLQQYFHAAMKAPGLYLIGVRDLQTGLEWTPALVASEADRFGLKRPDAFAPDVDALLKMAEEIKATECEGWVLHYASGLKVKVKGLEYVRLARFLQTLSAKHVFECVAAGTADIPPGVPEKYASRFRELVAQTNAEVALAVAETEIAWSQSGAIGVQASREERKAFAEKVNASRWARDYIRSLAFDRIRGPLQADRVFESLRRKEVWKTFERPEDERMQRAAAV